jgi:hypothetical protein
MVRIEVADPFDLPEWLADGDVLWVANGTVAGAARVRGRLVGAGADQQADLDLLAVDAAAPAPVCDERHRTLAHRAWRLREILLLSIDGRVTVAAPGYVFDPNLAIEALGRFARAVGAQPDRYAARLRL